MSIVGGDIGGQPQAWPADHLHRWCNYIGVLDAELSWRLPYTADVPPNAQHLFNATKTQLNEQYITDPQVAERMWQCIHEMKTLGLPPFHPMLRRTTRGCPWVGTKTTKWLQARKCSWAKGAVAKHNYAGGDT